MSYFRETTEQQYNVNKIAALPKFDEVYIHEWLTIGKKLYGIGIDENNVQGYIEPAIKFGLIVTARNNKYIKILENFALCKTIKKIENVANIKIIGHTIMNTIENNFTTNNWKFYKIYTETFANAMELFYLLTNNNVLVNYIKPPCLWNLDVFILLERYKNFGSWTETNNFCYYVWMNENLEILERKKPTHFEIMSFDVETVSPDPTRIPTGNLYSDYIVSASISIQNEQQQSIQQHSLIYAPIDDSGNLETQLETIDPLKKTHENVNEHKFYYFKTEQSLLQKLFSIFENNNQHYILLGYNSKKYDMQYLLFRAILLGMPEASNFYLQHGILCYGFNMMHLDLMLIIMKFYKAEMDNFRLNTVAKYCLEQQQKADVDAVAIRFTFEKILKSGSIQSNYGHKIPLVSEIVYYNDVDTLLLINIWNKLSYNTTIPDICKEYSISASRLCQSQVSEYISVKLFSKMFQDGNFFTYYPKQHVLENGKLIDFEKNITRDIDTYSGGLNYCDGRRIIRNLVCNDFVAYYPYLISGFNL